jgi:hypothetical protein
MKRLVAFGTLSAFAVATFITLGAAPATYAQQGGILGGVKAAKGTGVPTTLFGDTGIITTITNVLLFIAGALAVIMIIWGGLRYATSGGNSSNVTAAKNTVLYAIVGLIIAFLAFAIVNWILAAITPGAGGAGMSNR